MKYDELAFANQQLAGMLKSGLPREGSLRQLCESMQKGDLRDELQLLEKDLAQGTSLAEAVDRRKFPELYRLMVKAGVKGNDLPEVLTAMADYFSRMDSLWSRLKGLMVYPVIVLSVMSVVSLGIAILMGIFLLGKDGFYAGYLEFIYHGQTVPLQARPEYIIVSLGVPVLIFIALTIGTVSIFSIRGLFERFRWKMPGFEETSLSQLAMTISLLLRGGNTLHDSLGIARQLEGRTRIATGLAAWQSRIAAGVAHLDQATASKFGLPPLFLWIVNGSGEDKARGFSQAAEFYGRRAAQRTEALLYVVLPVAVVILGCLVLVQAVPPFQALIRLMDAIGNTGS